MDERTVAVARTASTSAVWERLAQRADELAAQQGPAASLLAFYSRLLRAQHRISEVLDPRRLSGTIECDAPIVTAASSSLIQLVADHGPAPLVAEAHTLIDGGDDAIRDALTGYWRDRSDRRFFAKALTQPYARCLADAGLPIAARADRDHRCPACGGAPQLSILDAGAMSGDGAGRRLLCATCLSAWPFRRVLCPSCGEEDERRLGYFSSPALDHLHVDACETCRRYLKSVDLGRLGTAAPLVDEVAGAALDLWAVEHGYQKVELNLVGL